MDTASNFDITETLKHFGVKGMKWGQHKFGARVGNKNGPTIDVKDIGAIRAARRSETKTKFAGNVKEAGGLHKVSDKDLKRMLERLNMEKRYNDILHEDAARRKAGFEAAGRILGEIGKAAIPAIITILASRASGVPAGHADTFKAGNVNVQPKIIEGVFRTLGK